MKSEGFKNVRWMWIVLASTLLMTTLCGQATGEVELVYEDFEAPPDVSAAQSDGNTSGADPAGWLGSDQGFGASRCGTVDEAHGDFTDPVGEQAYAFRYTNSGLTSDEGTIGDILADVTYTVSFDVVLDGHNSTTPYTCKLVAFHEGITERQDTRNDTGTTVLKTVSGNATGDGNYTTITFDRAIDPGADAAVVGLDLAVRFIGATSSAIIDNVEVTRTEPPTDGTLFSFR